MTSSLVSRGGVTLPYAAAIAAAYAFLATLTHGRHGLA
jgi:hypothetical protein